jgi:5-methylcytosine-specific restriction enzyme A
MATDYRQRVMIHSRSANRVIIGRPGARRRARWLRDNPLCVHCARDQRSTVACEVDHVIALVNGGIDDETNLQSLCHPCHVAKTLTDLNIKKRIKVGSDGFPIDD